MTMTTVAEHVDNYRSLVARETELNAFKDTMEDGDLSLFAKATADIKEMEGGDGIKTAISDEIDAQLADIATEKTTIENIFSAL